MSENELLDHIDYTHGKDLYDWKCGYARECPKIYNNRYLCNSYWDLRLLQKDNSENMEVVTNEQQQVT